MRHTRRLAAFLLLFGAACAGNPQSETTPQGESAPRNDRNVLTQKEMLDHHFQNAYEAVESLRSQWLQPRGPDSFNTPSQVWVYMDNVRLGDVESLRALNMNTIMSIRHLNANEATARWGVGHAAGVIYVQTLPSSGATPATTPDAVRAADPR